MAASTNPGCLSFIKQIFGIKSSSIETVQEDNGVDPFPYRVRDDFLSPAEQSFYLVLKGLMGDRFVICPKVSLADIFFVKRPNENKGAYNRINRKHVDFLICESNTMTPRFAIELDDSSHQRADREERDDFVDSVFKSACLSIVHVPVRSGYNPAELGVLFRKAIQQYPINSEEQIKPEVKTIPEGQPVNMAPQQIPTCPKCGVSMVLRVARNGGKAGEKFYGCPNYPKCREVAPYKS